ncbi:MAG: SIMPL domain-containing protein [Candidatus Gracilibacteria bacterium]|nr:SIMPL domain-containing protein [Candidatus Gracilibacteria bacterium]MDD5179616.1 SIMPL domain-containing protein [Candidatus Gracilibacteria bacterium]
MQDSKFIPAIVIALALIISATVFGSFYYSAQSVTTTDTLSVTGSTKVKVTSDKAKLVISLSRIALASTLATGYGEIAADLTATRDLLTKEKVDAATITENPVVVNRMYDYQNNGGELKYELTQSVILQADDVNQITAISKKIPSLAASGAIVSVQSLEYYYSKLPDLRVSLLTAAVKDAASRAAKIAEGTGRKIGNVQSASSGVVQVLPPNSIEVSDYGSYDTSSIEKEVMVTVKASFRLQ